MLFFLGVPQRLNGKVYGELNGYSFENHDMHVYIVTSDGRAYTAISRINPEVEGNLRSLVSIGGIMGWLFAQPQHPDAKNGYMLSGILSVRQLTICPCLPIYSLCLPVYSDNACNTDDSAMSLCIVLFLFRRSFQSYGHHYVPNRGAGSDHPEVLWTRHSGSHEAGDAGPGQRAAGARQFHHHPGGLHGGIPAGLSR